MKKFANELVTPLLLMLMFSFLAIAALGETQKKVESKKPPVITAEQYKAFYKARADMTDAELAVERTAEFKYHEQKVVIFLQAESVLEKACGDGFQLTPDLVTGGDPTCQAKAPLKVGTAIKK